MGETLGWQKTLFVGVISSSEGFDLVAVRLDRGSGLASNFFGFPIP